MASSLCGPCASIRPLSPDMKDKLVLSPGGRWRRRDSCLSLVRTRKARHAAGESGSSAAANTPGFHCYRGLIVLASLHRTFEDWRWLGQTWPPGPNTCTRWNLIPRAQGLGPREIRTLARPWGAWERCTNCKRSLRSQLCPVKDAHPV